MLQTALADCLFLDLLPFSENGFVPTTVDIIRCDVVQSLVVPLVVVVFDEGLNLAFKVAGHAVSPDRLRLPASRNSFDQLLYRLSEIPSRRHSAEMLSATRRPAKTLRIFSSAE